jgi:hypothetical protein
MSSDGEKCLELVYLDGSNYESWCNSILHYIEDFNPCLLNIVDASICPPNMNWANLSEEEEKCLKLNAQSICLPTQSLSPNVEAIIIKEHGFPMDAHLLWIYIKDMFSDTTVAQDSRGVGYLIKPVRPVGKTGQTGLAKSASSRLQRRKRHRSNQNSTSQTSPQSSAIHGKCLMAKGKKKKKPVKDDREEGEEDDEYDLDFDKLSKKDVIKIKSLFERLQEQELLLEQHVEYLIDKIEELKVLNEELGKLKHSHISFIGKHENLEKNMLVLLMYPLV